MKKSLQLLHRATYRVLSILLALALSACGEITWQKRLPLVSQFNATKPANRPSVFLEVSYLYDLGDGIGPRPPLDSRTTQFKALVEKVTEESSLFSSIGDDPNNVDLRIKIDYLGIVEFNNPIGSPTGHALTPGFSRKNYNQIWKIKATVTDRSQSTIGAYEVEDEVTVRGGAFIATSVWWNPGVFSQGLENMVRNIYQKMLDDKLLSRP